MGARLRPLWFLLISLAWSLLGYYFLTLKVLDPMGLQAVEVTGVTDAAAQGLIGGLPWLAWSALMVAGFLWWVVNDPAYRALRHSIPAAVFGVLTAFSMYASAIFAGHIERTATAAEAGGLLAAVAAAVFLPAALVVSLVANNRIWATPEPKRERRFGPRQV